MIYRLDSLGYCDFGVLFVLVDFGLCCGRFVSLPVGLGWLGVLCGLCFWFGCAWLFGGCWFGIFLFGVFGFLACLGLTLILRIWC